jgi:formylglycine-generating enzyme required for sulfatase activity
MAGNVWEWCLDSWYDDYQGAPTDGRPRGKKGDQKTKVLRGGSWINSPHSCRCAVRSRDDPDRWYDSLGFRVLVGVAWT